MKILMLTASLGLGGAETHIFELSRALSGRSHKIICASCGGEIAKRLALLGIRHVKLPLDSKKPKDILFSVLSLRKIIIKEAPDIIHTHSRIASFVLHITLFTLPKKRKNICIVSTIHARFKDGFIRRALSFWGRATIAVSEDLREHLTEKYGVFGENVTVIQNSIDTDKFSPSLKNTVHSDNTGIKILFVSRLDTDCALGASLLCRATPSLAKKHHNLCIDIAGGGKAYKKILREAQAANEKTGYECVSLLGHVKNIQDKLAASDIFVGVSRAALEAMSCALPVVLCGNEGFLGILDASNISRAQSTNFCCRDCELPTLPALSDALSSLINMTNAQRHALGAYLREYVCKHHGAEALAIQCEEFYKASISKMPADSPDTLLLGYYGFRNIGDDALLSAAIERERKKESRISVICRSPRKISRRYGVRAIGRTRFFAILREIQSVKRLVLGGGSILQNATSTRSLRYYTFLMRYAAKKGVKVELLANGLGPIKGKRGEKLAIKALSVCEKLSFRDMESAKYAARLLGCRADAKQITVENDLSCDIPPCSTSRTSRLLLKLEVDEKPFFLVSIKGSAKRKEAKSIAREVEAQKKGGLVPVFVVMHPSEDKKISRKFAKKHGGVCIVSLTPSELRALAERAEFAIGNRYHLLRFAALSGVPTIPFGDDPKMRAINMK